MKRPWLRGETHGRAKITEADVRAIRARYRWRDPEHGAQAIARERGLHHQTVLDIVNRVNWEHVQ